MSKTIFKTTKNSKKIIFYNAPQTKHGVCNESLCGRLSVYVICLIMMVLLIVQFVCFHVREHRKNIWRHNINMKIINVIQSSTYWLRAVSKIIIMSNVIQHDHVFLPIKVFILLNEQDPYFESFKIKPLLSLLIWTFWKLGFFFSLKIYEENQLLQY